MSYKHPFSYRDDTLLLQLRRSVCTFQDFLFISVTPVIRGAFLLFKLYLSTQYRVTLLLLKHMEEIPILVQPSRLNPGSDTMAGYCHSVSGVQQRFFWSDMLHLADRSMEQMSKDIKKMGQL